MVRSGGSKLPLNILFLLIGIVVIYRIATSKGFVKNWEDYIEEKLIKHRVFEEAPVEDLLHILEGYGLVRAVIGEDSTLAGKSLTDIRSGEKHIIFLGIERGHDWIPVPKATEKILEGDRVVAYGHLDTLKEHFKNGD
jgi:Trk K+ transport system NAD-binding subunit